MPCMWSLFSFDNDIAQMIIGIGFRFKGQIHTKHSVLGRVEHYSLEFIFVRGMGKGGYNKLKGIRRK